MKGARKQLYVLQCPPGIHDTLLHLTRHLLHRNAEITPWAKRASQKIQCGCVAQYVQGGTRTEQGSRRARPGLDSDQAACLHRIPRCSLGTRKLKQTRLPLPSVLKSSDKSRVMAKPFSEPVLPGGMPYPAGTQRRHVMCIIICRSTGHSKLLFP